MDYKLIAGLGNPGPEYEETRHNAGFLALDLLADELGAHYWKNECGALVAHVQHGGEELLLAKCADLENAVEESCTVGDYCKRIYSRRRT